MANPPLKMPKTIDGFDALISETTHRDEERLLRAARASGYFDRRVTSTHAKAMFTAFLKSHSVRQSQLARLKQEKKRMAARVSEEQRRLDARQKILLGSFLIAQFEHDPAFLAKMQPQLDKFLSLHKDAKVAESNKEALAHWLGRETPATPIQSSHPAKEA